MGWLFQINTTIISTNIDWRWVKYAVRDFSGDPGSKEIIKTHRKSLLELPGQIELLSGFHVKKNKFLFIRIISYNL
jgi:hypothetical protein